jgi:small subunit ribosomal protein S2
LATEFVKELVDAGIHFGHRVSRWNPKMKPYIFGRRNLIHIIDVKETLRGILLGRKFLSRTVSRGKDVLFVGTKRQARKAVEENALRVGMHYVNDRWLGGTLTNFREIRKRVGRLDQLEQMEADGLLDQYSKKQGASLRREMRRIRRNLGGIRRMTQQPGALIVVDQRRELIAVREANKMGIPIVCLLDTDSDPNLVDIPIPGNDDAMRAIELVIRHLANAVAEGVNARATAEADREGKPAPRRRSRRATTARAGPVPDAPAAAEDAAPAETAPAEPAPSPASQEPPEAAPPGPDLAGEVPAQKVPAQQAPESEPQTQTDQV